MTTQNHTAISISMDGTWAGSGKLLDGIIEDCGAQFCDDTDVSEGIYSQIEESIAKGHDSLNVTIDGVRHDITWSIVEPE